MRKENTQRQIINSTENLDFLRQSLYVIGDIPSLIMGSGVNTDLAIDESLSRVGMLLDASRTYVMLDEKNGCYLRNTHEWVNRNIGASMFSWPLYDYEYDIPSLKGILDTDPMVFSNTRNLPQDLQAILTKQGVRTVILAAIHRDNTRIGVVGVDFCDREVDYLPEYASILTYLTGLISLALERKQYQGIRCKINSIRHIIADVEPMLESEEVDLAQPNRPNQPVSLMDAERRIIIETLELYNGNKLKTAKHLGLTWPSLDRRCKKMGIEVRKR